MKNLENETKLGSKKIVDIDCWKLAKYGFQLASPIYGDYVLAKSLRQENNNKVSWGEFFTIFTLKYLSCATLTGIYLRANHPEVFFNIWNSVFG